MTSKAFFAVLAGAGVGFVAAIGLWRPAPSKPPALAAAPGAAAPFAPPAPLEATHRATEAELPVATAVTAVTTPAPSARPEPSVPPSLPTAPDDEVPIATKEEFQAAAIACDEKDAGACRRAAAAADTGTVVPKDPERAKTFRKVELTAIVRACEKKTVTACLTLADRYLRGDGVAQNERTAAALIEHVKEICAHRHEDACRAVPSN
jgi:TPR repeat protein